MKFIKFFSFLLLFAMVALTACKKEEINTTDVDPDPIDPTETVSNGLITRSLTDEEGLNLGCLTIEYPFSLLMLDSSTVIIESEDDFTNALSDSTNYPIDFVYPLNVTLEDGSTQTVNNADELGALFANCIPDTGWEENDSLGVIFPAWDINFDNSCFQLVYPVTLVTLEGTSVTAADETELVSYLSDGNFYSFSFPISLEDQDGNVLVVADGDELLDLLVSCNPGGGGNGGGACTIGGFACYRFDYPVILLKSDGSTVTVNNDDEFTAEILSGDWVGYQYPLTLIAPDDSEIVVNSDEELNDALLACGNVGGGGVIDTSFVMGDFFCYNFEFPIQVILNMNPNPQTFNNQTEWLEATQNGFAIFGFVYPINLIHSETEETITVNSDLELGEAVEECY